MLRYGIIGFPLLFSFSKTYFEEKFKKENIAGAAFELFPLKEIGLFAELIKERQDLLGLAVTIPHKQAVMPYLTELHESAKNTGAVNCIKFSGEKRIGYNTDSIGFEKSLLPWLQPSLTGNSPSPDHRAPANAGQLPTVNRQLNIKALVLGTGGASKAVQYILKKNKIEFLLVSRTPSAARMISYDDLSTDIMNEYQLIINCSPVGMTPDDESKPDIPYHLLSPGHLLYDLIYKPEKTRFLEEGEKQGCTIKNGMEMLLIQAEANWAIWND